MILRLAGAAVLLALWTAPAAADTRLTYMLEDGEHTFVMLAHGDGTGAAPLTSGDVMSLYPDISADGRSVAYSTGLDPAHLGIAVWTIDSGVTEYWTAQDGLYLHSDLSGDGHFLAFSGPVGPAKAQRVGVIDLVRERAKGPAATRGKDPVFQPTLTVIPSDYPSYFPALASTGEFLVYQRSKGATKDIVLRDLASGDETQVTPADGYAMEPSLSFDDRYVAYTARVDGQWDIYIKDLVKDQTVRVTNTPYLDYAPTFRADGSLVYAADGAGHFELFEISAASLHDLSFTPHLLATAAGDLYSPAVSGEIQPVQNLRQEVPAPARSSFGAVALAGKVYLAGGHQGPEHTYPEDSFSARLDIYDEATGTWHAGAPLSLARHGFGLAAYGGYVYAFGGFTFSADHDPQWKSVDLIERYDVAADRWEVIGHLPRARSSNVVAQVGTKVYLMGGWDSTPRAPGDYEGQFLEAIDVFDIATGAVSTLPAPLPAPKRRALSSVVVGDEIILVGGLGVGSTHFELLDNVSAFNTVTQTWRELPRLPFATFAPAAGVVGGNLFVFGGMLQTGEESYTYIDHVYGLALDGGAWRNTGRYLNEAKGFSQVVPLAPDTLGILGGHMQAADEDHPVSTFEAFRLPPTRH